MAVGASSVVTKPGIRLTLLALLAFVAWTTVSQVALASPESPSSEIAAHHDAERELSSRPAPCLEDVDALSVAELEVVEPDDTEPDPELYVPALGASLVLSGRSSRRAEDSTFVSRAAPVQALRSSVSARAPPLLRR